MWFVNIAPLGVVFSLIGMGLDYWVVKFMFCNVYRQPKKLSKKIINFVDFL